MSGTKSLHDSGWISGCKLIGIPNGSQIGDEIFEACHLGIQLRTFLFLGHHMVPSTASLSSQKNNLKIHQTHMTFQVKNCCNMLQHVFSFKSPGFFNLVSIFFILFSIFFPYLCLSCPKHFGIPQWITQNLLGLPACSLRSLRSGWHSHPVHRRGIKQIAAGDLSICHAYQVAMRSQKNDFFSNWTSMLSDKNIKHILFEDPQNLTMSWNFVVIKNLKW